MQSVLFLHTSPAHIATFNILLAEMAADIQATHVVDESLLRDARTYGITPELQGRISQAVQHGITAETAIIICTCSTIGGTAEHTPGIDRPILRVDRAMAEQAIATGSRILLVAVLASTLEPTRHLLEEVAVQSGRDIGIAELLCDTAWPYFEQGDLAGYHANIAEYLHTAAPSADVIVLAQASMAGAVAYCTDLTIPILSSPRLGVEAALQALGRQSVAPIETGEAL